MNATATPEIAAAGSPVTLDAVFGELESQRWKAIGAFWTTLGKTLLMVPLCLLPGLLLVPTGDASDAIWLTKLMEAIASTFALDSEQKSGAGMVIAMGGTVWCFGGLVLLARYFHRRGRQPGRDYVAEFKTRVFGQVCASRFPGLSYDPTNGIPWRMLDDSKLFPWVCTTYTSEDFFTGRLGQTDVQFAEAIARRERKRLRRGRFETYLDTYFQGLIFIADFHKHFQSTTRIMPANEKHHALRSQKPVVLEDPDFTARFITTSTDQVNARYVLSTAMVQRILKLSDRFPGLRVLLADERMLLLLPSQRDRFEASLYRKASCSRQIDEFVRDIEAVLPIVDELSLNTRIWTKA